MHYIVIVSMLLLTSCLRADWAQDQLASMSLEQKVGQIFMPSFLINRPMSFELMIRLITQYHVGGILLLHDEALPIERHTPCQQAQLINELQRHAHIPLLISQDLEWGLLMRLKGAVRFPRTMTLGAIKNKQLIYDLGKEIGRQCKLLGVHINFAPVVDVNCNPKNPVIHDRSFGSDVEEVTERALLYMRGMSDVGVITCAKHFPGHGDTDVDSHLDLPIIRHSKELLAIRELYPFKKMIEAGVPMIMTAHLHIPDLDDTPGVPASLSKKVVTNLLKQELGFTGILVTDGLRMRGVSKHFDSGKAAVMALCAGNDLLIDSEDPIEAIEAVINAVREGVVSEKQLDESVLKILLAKQSVGLDHYVEQLVPASDEFHATYAYQLKGELFAQAITLVRDRDHLLPLQLSASSAVLFIESEKTALHKRVDQTASMAFALEPDANDHAVVRTEQELAVYETIVIGIFGMNKCAHKQFGIGKAQYNLIERLHNQGKRIVLVLFGTPYAVSLFDQVGTILVAYEDDIDAQFAAARVLMGLTQATGRLPI